jgi:hypothetical protein
MVGTKAAETVSIIFFVEMESLICGDGVIISFELSAAWT